MRWRLHALSRLWLPAALTFGLWGCAELPAKRLGALMPADLLLIGEQHDSPEHKDIHRQFIEILAAQQQLDAVVIEMADQGRSTVGLPRDAKAPEVKAALGWNDQAWTWDAYAPALMTAVEFGVPVLGANLPRDRQRQAMQDPSLDFRLSAAALKRQQEAIRDSHCGLLAESQVVPMTRIQIARDLSMAQTLLKAREGRQHTVVLLAGSGHVLKSQGVPVHLPRTVRVRVLVPTTETQPGPELSEEADMVWRTRPLAPRDYCAELRERMS